MKWTYASEQFPPLNVWVALRDINGDLSFECFDNLATVIYRLRGCGDYPIMTWCVPKLPPMTDAESEEWIRQEAAVERQERLTYQQCQKIALKVTQS